MIIYGWKTRHIKTDVAQHSTCSECGAKGMINTSVWGKFVHIFWIPVFSLGKTGTAQCQNCKHVMEAKDMPRDIRSHYDILRKQTGIQFTHYTGLVIIAIAAAFILKNGQEQKETELTYLSSPVVGDVYEYKMEDNNYSTFKVVSVEDDSVYFLMNEYMTDKRTGVDDIDIESYYGTDEYVSSKSNLKEMYEDGTIFGINRKKIETSSLEIN